MQDLENCIIKLGEVAVLIRMIDDTFVCAGIGISKDQDGAQLEQSFSLLRDQFQHRYETLRKVFYGGAKNE